MSRIVRILSRRRLSFCAMVLALGAPIGSLSASATGSDGVPDEWRPVVDSSDALSDACADVLFIGARGSGESFASEDGMGRAVREVRDGLQASLRGAGLSVRQYKLDYPAYGLAGADDSSTLEGGLRLTMDQIAYGHEVTQPLYFFSVDLGVSSLLRIIEDSGARCPAERVVLAGYSAGAMVIHKAMTQLGNEPRVAGIALVADPVRDVHYADAGGYYFGDAWGNSGLVPWLRGLVDFDGLHAVLGTDVPELPMQYRVNTYDVCDHGDPVCAPVDLRSLDDLFAVSFEAHGAYGGDDSAASGGPQLREIGARIARTLYTKQSAIPREDVTSRRLTPLVDDGLASWGTGRAAAFDDGTIYMTAGVPDADPESQPRGVARIRPGEDVAHLVTAGVGEPGYIDIEDVATDNLGNYYTAGFFAPSGGGSTKPRGHYVSKFSASGRRILTFSVEEQVVGDPGPHYTRAPLAMDVDSRGRVLVLSRGQVFLYSPSGIPLNSVPVRSNAVDLSLDSSDELILLNGCVSLGEHSSISRWEAASRVSYSEVSRDWVSPAWPSPCAQWSTIESDGVGNVFLGGSPADLLRVSRRSGSQDLVPVPESGTPYSWYSSKAVAATTDGLVFSVFDRYRENERPIRHLLQLSYGPLVVPGAPLGVSARPGDRSAVVTWSGVQEQEGTPITYTATAAPGGESCASSDALSCTVRGLTNGVAYTFTVVASNAAGDSPPSEPSRSVVPMREAAQPSVVGDFDGNGASDRGVYRGGRWLAETGLDTWFGLDGWASVPADFDGDGREDLGAWDPQTGAWHSPARAQVTYFGLSGDVPVPGDYDGDGREDVAVWRPEIGGWFVEGSTVTYLGLSSDVPVPGDYDGDGDDDFAVFRPETGAWFVDGAAEPTYFGLSSDVPVPADYDGDGADEIAVWRPETGAWFVDGQRVPRDYFGLSSDVPVPGHYSGTASADLAVFRPGSGAWLSPSAAPVYFGAVGDRPLTQSWAVWERYFLVS